MGIYLPNVEMPKTCYYCRMRVQVSDGDIDWHWECCLLCEKVARYATDRIPGCPLVPVPPHGRLIDADALAEQYAFAQEQRGKDKTDYSNAFMNNGELCTEWWCVEDMLENAPTVLESEEGET